MDNNKKDKNVFGEEPKETKDTKRTRSPNRTKADKLADIDKKIEYHEKCKKSNQEKIKSLVKINNDHDAAIESLKAERAEVEKAPDKISKGRRLAEIKAKHDRGEQVTAEEWNFVMDNIK